MLLSHENIDYDCMFEDIMLVLHFILTDSIYFLFYFFAPFPVLLVQSPGPVWWCSHGILGSVVPLAFYLVHA